MNPKEIDCIIIATTTPDNTFPSTATKVQNYFKISNIPSFDIQAVCSGFIYGIQIADAFIKSGKYNKILLIGAETLSKSSIGKTEGRVFYLAMVQDLW